MKRGWILPTVLGFITMAAFGFWGYSQREANRQLENYLSNSYQRAFFEMCAQVQNLEVLLSKSLVVSDPRLCADLFREIRQQAAFAQANLGQLPVQDVLTGRTAKFLSQLGGYAESLARQVGEGRSIGTRHWETLNELYVQCVNLNRELQGMSYKVAENNFYFHEMVRQLQKNWQNPTENSAVTDFKLLDQRLKNTPTLIYDGPFSEHLEGAEPRATLGKPEIGPDKARDLALSFIEKKPGLNYTAEKVSPVEEGRIPSYRVEVAGQGEAGTERTVLDISRRGGMVVWMLGREPAGPCALGVDEARNRAVNFLRERGFGDVRSTYYQIQGNAVTFNFAPLQDGVTLYPDLVKVTVNLDDGSIGGLEASGYLMSHCQRKLPEPAITAEQAARSLNPRLNLSGGRLALVPVTPGVEKLTYEFLGKLGEESFLIYVNALDGREEVILKLIETPGGTLTM